MNARACYVHIYGNQPPSVPRIVQHIGCIQATTTTERMRIRVYGSDVTRFGITEYVTPKNC